MIKYITYLVVALAIMLVYSYDNLLSGSVSDGRLVEEIIGFFLLLIGFVLAGGIVERILKKLEIRWSWKSFPIFRFLADLVGVGLLTTVSTILIILGTWSFFEVFGIPKSMDLKEQTLSNNPDRGLMPARPGPPRPNQMQPPPEKNPRERDSEIERPPNRTPGLNRPPLGIRNRNFAEAWKYNADIFFGSFILFFLVFMFEESRLNVKRSEKEKFNAMQLAQDQMLSRINALKGQINPHFMFNNLNTLSGLIHEDVNRADKFIQSLSKNLRYVLELNQEIVVPLEKEIEFIKSYIHLQEERFGHKLKIQIDINQDEKDFELPALTLELLIENSLKHNIVSNSKPLNIKVFVEGEFLVVSNNYQPKTEQIVSTGIGLRNLKEQLDLLGLTGAKFGIEGKLYVAKVPMLRIPKINPIS